MKRSILYILLIAIVSQQAIAQAKYPKPGNKKPAAPLKTEGEKLIDAFCTGQISSISFAKRRASCAMNREIKIAYTYNSGQFVLNTAKDIDEGDSNASENLRSFWFYGLKSLHAKSETIPEQVVTDFVKKLPIIYNKLASIGDLQYTEEEYDQCKQDILSFKASSDSGITTFDYPGFRFSPNNHEFDKLISLVDSIKTLDKARLNRLLFDLSRKISTCSYRVVVQLTNNRNEMMEIANEGDGFAFKSFYFPWTITINGKSFQNTAIDINQFIAQTCPNLIVERNRVWVLYDLVQCLYLNRFPLVQFM